MDDKIKEKPVRRVSTCNEKYENTKHIHRMATNIVLTISEIHGDRHQQSGYIV